MHNPSLKGYNQQKVSNDFQKKVWDRIEKRPRQNAARYLTLSLACFIVCAVGVHQFEKKPMDNYKSPVLYADYLSPDAAQDLLMFY